MCYNKEIGMMKMALTLSLLVRITLTLILSSVITGCFQKVNLFIEKINFQRFNFQLYEILSCHLHSCMRQVSYLKNMLFL